MVHYPRQTDSRSTTCYRLLGYTGVAGILLALVLAAGVVLLTVPLSVALSGPTVATLVFTILTVLVALIAHRFGNQI